VVGAMGNPLQLRLIFFLKKTAREAFHVIQEAFIKASHVLPVMNQDIAYPHAMRF
jgi:hypothetical protein